MTCPPFPLFLGSKSRFDHVFPNRALVPFFVPLILFTSWLAWHSKQAACRSPLQSPLGSLSIHTRFGHDVCNPQVHDPLLKISTSTGSCFPEGFDPSQRFCPENTRRPSFDPPQCCFPENLDIKNGFSTPGFNTPGFSEWFQRAWLQHTWLQHTGFNTPGFNTPSHTWLQQFWLQ